jgi:hypothetical protein
MGASKVQNIGKVQRLLFGHLQNGEGFGNFLLFVDSHSDYQTGMVTYATRKSDGVQLVDAVPAVSLGYSLTPQCRLSNEQIIDRFLGKALKAELPHKA